MPHAQAVPSAGFQALILCGPGVSLNTFTSSPDEFPKALVPIANRPMVWYPLEWCYRLGITNIRLITPPSSAAALETAFSQNPHLTSLPLPKPDIIAPRDLTQTTGTAEILRLPEVQKEIVGDFLLLPCDLVCEIGGEAFLELWMIQQAGLGGASGVPSEMSLHKMSIGGEKGGRRGGLGVWYQTKGDGGVKGEETDFVATSPLPAPVVSIPPGSHRQNLSHLVYSIPTDTLKDITEEKKSFPVRHSLLRKHANVKMLTTHRDAHIYFFPYWILDMVKRNEKMDSIAEDVVGWWAKAGWQDGLGEKLGLRDVFDSTEEQDADENNMGNSTFIEEDIDVGSMSSTWTSQLGGGISDHNSSSKPSSHYASRVQDPRSTLHPLSASASQQPKSKLLIPPMLAYTHSQPPSTTLLHRVDTAALLLTVSLRLAKLDSLDDLGPGNRTLASPFAHASKVAYPPGLASRCTVTRGDCLIAENVTVEERAVIKESVIGANCKVEAGARLTRCLLMDGTVVGEKCKLDGCILGRRSRIGKESVLRDCEVQEGNVIPDETDAKNEKFMIFEGLDDESAEGGDAFDLSGGNGDGEDDEVLDVHDIIAN
ncbi:MAG: hypothetical protein M1819_005919 [Sarea resinae]|nr:MAG: hypothetical protein M1819_005919 [Sarea resinae]